MATVTTRVMLVLATLMVVIVVVPVEEAIMDRVLGTIAIRMVHSGAI